EAVERLLERLQAPLLLDNAYAEFCRHDYRPLLRRHRHLVIFRTFSKAWSLGGLRLGYLLADPALVHELIKIKLPYNIGLGHVEAACEVLDRPGPAERRVRAILGRRPQWRAMFEEVGYRPLPSEANFFLVEVGPDVAGIREGLEARGIRVRDVSKYPGLDGFMRVSVGSGPALRDTRSGILAIQEHLRQKPRRHEPRRHEQPRREGGPA
ncbi:MAG: aminotransferase class I/II-fold pyridoxal phosphate-dependent enzyme, partial [Acidobacteriota bacterium]